MVMGGHKRKLLWEAQSACIAYLMLGGLEHTHQESFEKQILWRLVPIMLLKLPIIFWSNAPEFHLHTAKTKEWNSHQNWYESRVYTVHTNFWYEMHTYRYVHAYTVCITFSFMYAFHSFKLSNQVCIPFHVATLHTLHPYNYPYIKLCT